MPVRQGARLGVLLIVWACLLTGCSGGSRAVPGVLAPTEGLVVLVEIGTQLLDEDKFVAVPDGVGQVFEQLIDVSFVIIRPSTESGA